MTFHVDRHQLLINGDTNAPLTFHVDRRQLLLDNAAPVQNSEPNLDDIKKYLEDIVNNTSEPSTLIISKALVKYPELPFSYMQRHIRVKAASLQYSRAQEIKELLLAARDCSLPLEEIVKLFSQDDLPVLRQIFCNALLIPAVSSSYFIQVLPLFVPLEIPPDTFTLSHFETMQSLGVDLNRPGLFNSSPLVSAFMQQKETLVKFLLAAGCPLAPLFDPDPIPPVRRYFRHIGISDTKKDPNIQVEKILKSLESLGAKFNPHCPFEDDVLVKLLMRNAPISYEIVKFFDKHQFRLSEKRVNDLGVLQWACQQLAHQDPKIINLINNLLEYHFSPDETIENGIPPLVYALHYGPEFLVERFIYRYVDLNVIILGSSLLHIVLLKFPQLSLQKIAPRLDLFRIDTYGRTPADLAFASNNSNFLKEVIVPRCSLIFTSAQQYTLTAVSERLLMAIESEFYEEAAEAALLFNLPSVTQNVLQKVKAEGYLEIMSRLRKKHPQINPPHVFNHLFVIAPRAKFNAPEYHPFVRIILDLPHLNPSQLLIRVAELIPTDSAAIDLFKHLMPAQWKNGHYKNLHERFSQLLEMLEGRSDLLDDEKKETVDLLMTQYQLPQIPGLHNPLEVIEFLAFEDFLNDFVLKRSSVECALFLLKKIGLLEECAPDLISKIFEGDGKL